MISAIGSDVVTWPLLREHTRCTDEIGAEPSFSRVIPAHSGSRLLGCAVVVSLETIRRSLRGGSCGPDLERWSSLLGSRRARDRRRRDARRGGRSWLRPGGRFGDRGLPPLAGGGRSGRSRDRGRGGAASAAQLDVTDQASVDRFVAQADELYGRA